MSANVEPQGPVFNERSTEVKRCGIPKRYVQALLASVALFISFWMRTSFISAVIAIIISFPSRNEIPVVISHFGFMELSLDLSFTVSQIPGALLAIKFSSHRVLLISMMATTLFHTVLPFILFTSAPLIIFFRILQGIAMGPFYPACIGIWKLWAPPSERTSIFSVVSCGALIGLAAGYPLNTALANYFGPRASLFAPGVVGLIWCLLWVTLTYESPASHPHISQHEKMYLEENTDVDSKLEVTVKSIPWKSILLSLPVWAICLANVCFFSNLFIMEQSSLFYMFHFLNEEFNRNLDVLLPNIILGVIVAISGFFIDFAINRAYLSRHIARKLHCSIAFILHGIAILIFKYCPGFQSSLISINVGQGLLFLALTGFMVNCLDISAHYATVVIAVCVTIGSIGDMVAPFVKAWYMDPHDAYFTGFDILISMSFATALFYAVFGSGNAQSWGKPETTCSQSSEDETSRSTYYSYPDGADCVELIMDRHESSNDCTVVEKERY